MSRKRRLHARQYYTEAEARRETAAEEKIARHRLVSRHALPDTSFDVALGVIGAVIGAPRGWMITWTASSTAPARAPVSRQAARGPSHSQIYATNESTAVCSEVELWAPKVSTLMQVLQSEHRKLTIQYGTRTLQTAVAFHHRVAPIEGNVALGYYRRDLSRVTSRQIIGWVQEYP